MTKNNVFSKKEMTIEFCHIQGYINIKTNFVGVGNVYVRIQST